MKKLLILLIPLTLSLTACSVDKEQIRDGDIITKKFTQAQTSFSVDSDGFVTDDSTPDRYSITIKKMVPEYATYSISKEHYDKLEVGRYVVIDNLTNLSQE